ncbi:MAG: MFS transporter, partial [Burkholderiales bacterium]
PLWIASQLQIPMPSAEEQRGATRSIREIARQPVFIVALLGAVTAYGVMNLLMAAAPLAMQLCGHPYNAQILVIEGHLVAMFAPAFFTGWLIARIGTLPVMFTGVLCNIVAVAAAVTGLTVFNFWIAMVLIGVGWCFLFIGGTTLLTEAYRPAEKAKSQGTNDLLVFLAMASSSLASGAILHRFGWTPLNLSALPLLAITGVSIAWLAALRRVAAGRALPAAAE